jgi:hypothetical protein
MVSLAGLLPSINSTCRLFLYQLASLYGSAPQTWTRGANRETVYGYFIRSATSARLIRAEAFASPRGLGSGDTLSFTPTFGDT